MKQTKSLEEVDVMGIGTLERSTEQRTKHYLTGTKPYTSCYGRTGSKKRVSHAWLTWLFDAPLFLCRGIETWVEVGR